MVIFEKRWNIEVLFKELRNSLGFCDYQVLSRNAIERHLHLCCMVHLMLTHQSPQGRRCTSQRENDKEVTLPPFERTSRKPTRLRFAMPTSKELTKADQEQ